MACLGCMKNRTSVRPPVTEDNTKSYVVEESVDPTDKIKLRYYGGGSKVSTRGGCSTCRGKSSNYAVTTSETIQFVSKDAPGGFFKQTFSIGHDYYVTEKQAEYLLSLTYVNKAGQTVNKFERV